MAKMYSVIPAGFESDEEEMDHMMASLKIKRLEDITTGKRHTAKLTRRSILLSKLFIHIMCVYFRCWHQW